MSRSNTATLTPPKAAPVVKKPRRGGRYANIKHGPRDDIPGEILRSSVDANTYRWLHWVLEGNAPRDPYLTPLLGEHGIIINVEYEKEHGYPATYHFPGVGTTGRAKYTPDVPFQILWHDVNHNTRKTSYTCMWFYIEGKGVLKEGGWLRDLDLTPLKKVDSRSAEKLRRWKQYRPGEAMRTFLLGQREYKVLCKLYADIIPGWEK